MRLAPPPPPISEHRPFPTHTHTNNRTPLYPTYQRRQPALSVPADVDDIDVADRAEPLACVDYVEDQYRHYREKECRPGYVDDGWTGGGWLFWVFDGRTY